MKVQLQDQSVRLRLDEAELARLLAGESVENMTRFGGIEGWGMAVSLHGGEQPVLLDAGTFCRLVLPRPAVEALAARLPCRDGLPFDIALEDGGQLQLQFDVDVRDSVRQRGVTRRTTAPSV
ncbi:DUF7009 family protein [Stenotrophomonas maltophilia]|uniref:DUF7009 family protein n=1 Tax=Stenotrophomonas TaxID=40323 RepID=UPI0010AA51C3|nr:hypothetical protein [Stenotrophomonas maltophilia]TIE21627.1 hypothetical protein DI034_00320 [Stenotrophomonas maltophilia]TIE66027.1 hypothetical protein DI041_01180 [Stenotrophomonas maltophilia]HEL7749481.1 hypothetical protein [Stenotrophomonas maltophilia]